MSHLATYLAIAPKSPEELVLRLLIELGAQVVNATEGSLLVYDPTANDRVFAMTVGAQTSPRAPSTKAHHWAAATREVQTAPPRYGVKQRAHSPARPRHRGAHAHRGRARRRHRRRSSREALSARTASLRRLAAVAGVVVQQRRQLKTIEDQAKAGVVQGDDVEHRIAGSLASIGKHGGATALARVAKILAELEGLTGGGAGDLEVP